MRPAGPSCGPSTPKGSRWRAVASASASRRSSRRRVPLPFTGRHPVQTPEDGWRCAPGRPPGWRARSAGWPPRSPPRRPPSRSGRNRAAGRPALPATAARGLAIAAEERLSRALAQTRRSASGAVPATRGLRPRSWDRAPSPPRSRCERSRPATSRNGLALRAAFGERPRRLALEVDDVGIGAGDQHLAQMEIAMDARHRACLRRFRPAGAASVPAPRGWRAARVASASTASLSQSLRAAMASNARDEQLHRPLDPGLDVLAAGRVAARRPDRRSAAPARRAWSPSCRPIAAAKA